MQTDRELLELAARAAGLPVDMDDEGGIGWFACGTDADGEPVWWNPLKSDGDALRLAVNLKLQVACGTFKDDEVAVYHFGKPAVIETGDDIGAATRRAIVRAAAALAASQPQETQPHE